MILLLPLKTLLRNSGHRLSSWGGGGSELVLLPLKTPLRVFYSFIFWGGAKSAESGECFFYKERGECDPRDDRGGVLSNGDR